MQRNKPQTISMAGRLISNSAAYVTGDVFYRLINFLSAVLVARSLGSESYGHFSFVFVYLTFFEVLSQMGMNNILTREVAQNEDQAAQWLGNALWIRSLALMLLIPAAWFFVAFFHYPFRIRHAVFLASFQLILGLRTVFETIFRVKLKMGVPAFWNGMRALFNLGFIAAIYFIRPSLSLFILASLASGLVALAGLWTSSLKYVRYPVSLNPQISGVLLRQSLPLLASGILTFFCQRSDIFLLSKMQGFSSVAYYSIAMRFTEALSIIASSTMVSLFPLLSQAYAQDIGRFKRLASHTFRLFLLITLPLAVGGGIISKDLVGALFGEKFAPAGTSLMILLWAMVANFLGILQVNLLYACRKQMVDVWVTLLQILVNVGLNLLWIPRYSYNGAALAAAVSSFFAVGLMAIYLARLPGIAYRFSLREGGKAVFVNGVLGGFLILIQHVFHWPFWGVMMIAFFFYGFLLILFKILPWKGFPQQAGPVSV